MTKLRTSDVFGVSAKILPASYVDRGDLDTRLNKLLGRSTHVALRGESKCGKSWLRQHNLPSAIVVQCRLKKRCLDLYNEILAELNIELIEERIRGGSTSISASSTGEAGNSLLAKIAVSLGVKNTETNSLTTMPIGKDASRLKFVCDAIKASGRRLVVEDFHYLSVEQRQEFAFDLKAMWDYECFAVIVGVWQENNLLLHLNPDLSGRVEEVVISWSEKELERVIDQGCKTLNIYFSTKIKQDMVSDAFGSVGIIQRLALSTLDEAEIYEKSENVINVIDYENFESAAMQYADQLNTLYQTFAKRVAGGIRSRQNSTGIYAHALSVCLSKGAGSLSDGLTLDEIYSEANQRESRIQKGNLRQALNKFAEIQVDSDGRGLILSYDDNKSELHVVDKALFFYQKYCTVRWPWEDLIEQIENEASRDAYTPE